MHAGHHSHLWLALVLALVLGPVLAAPASETALATATSFTGLFVLPDDGIEPFITEIDAAQRSVDVYVYLLSDRQIIAALKRAHVRNVAIRVMLEPAPFGGSQTELLTYQQLHAAGIDVRWSNRYHNFAHVKLIIVDQSVALIMTLNLTETAFNANRDFAMITNDTAIVEHAATIFEADWSGSPPPLTGPLVVSPENSRLALLTLIEDAELTLDLYAEVFTDQQLADALVAAVERGVRVRLVMSEVNGESLVNEEPGSLARSGVEVRIVSSPYIHAKAIIADGERTWIGSQNFTSNSLDNNREIGIITPDAGVLARVVRAFETDFHAGTPLPGS